MRNEQSDHLRKLLKASHLYCKAKGEISYRKIAKAFDQNYANYGKRLIEESKLQGIITFEYKYHPPRLAGLEYALVQTFSALRDAIVTPSTEDYEFQRRLWGEAAAEYFDKEIALPKTKVGLSGGNTLYEMIAALPEKDRDIILYPTAIIGRGPTVAHVDPIANVTLLWAKSGRKADRAHYVTVLPFEKGQLVQDVRKEYKQFLKRAKVQAVLEEMKSLDAVVTSLGPANASAEYMKYTHSTTLGLLKEMGITKEKLLAMGAVGDICYCYLKEDGSTSPDLDFFLTLGRETLVEMASKYPHKKVVVIAGKHKMDPLRAVLKGRLCSVLITDELTAEELVRNFK
ncbi:MAG: sugar-binding domain-containing protein [Acidobacteriia bacterium]|nr:sugar-binding domain-containing protein [Terriglobia bacterium]